jgi:hypothetical protein
MSPEEDAWALECGMEPIHAARIREFCQGKYRRKKLLMIVRACKPEGLKWHSMIGASPKPVAVKEKTNAGGYIIRDNRLYYPDYDMQGLYELRDTTYYRFFAGNYVNLDQEGLAKLAAREPSLQGIQPAVIGTTVFSEFLNALNSYVCRGGAPMFQHGAQDGHLLGGRPVLDAGDGYLVFEPDGAMRILRSRQDLKTYYKQNRIAWTYRG